MSAKSAKRNSTNIKKNRMSEVWWDQWDRIRSSHPKLQKYMDMLEIKMLNRVLGSDKRQAGCIYKFPVSNVFDCPKTNFLYKESEKKCIYEVVIKPRSAPDFMEEKKNVSYYPDYVAALEDTNIIPCTDVVIKDGVMLSDRFEYDKQFQSTLLIKRMACDKENIVLRINKTERLKGECIDLCYAGGGNIWHLTHWMISKMRLINSIGALNNVPLLMDEHIKTNKFARAYIDCFNQNNHKIIYLKKDRLYHAEKVYMISVSGVFMRAGQDDQSVTVCSKKFAPYVRDIMLKKLHETDRKRKFFIKRSDRRLVNEKEVISYLRSKGFEVIQPEKYSFIDELSLFYNAECIIGATGAGFTNILYPKNECSVICIASEERIHNATSLATDVQDIGVKVYYCPAKAVSKNGVPVPMVFRVEIAEIEKLLNHIYPD